MGRFQASMFPPGGKTGGAALLVAPPGGYEKEYHWLLRRKVDDWKKHDKKELRRLAKGMARLIKSFGGCRRWTTRISDPNYKPNVIDVYVARLLEEK